MQGWLARVLGMASLLIVMCELTGAFAAGQQTATGSGTVA